MRSAGNAKELRGMIYFLDCVSKYWIEEAVA